MSSRKQTATVPQQRPEKGILRKRLILWVVFSIVVGLAPLAIKVFWIKLTAQHSAFGISAEQSLNWLELASYQGELLLLAAGLSAAGLGDLLGTGARNPPWEELKIVIGGICVINLIVGCMLYGFLSEVYQHFGRDQISTVAICSLISFGGAVLASGFCVMLSVKGN